MPDQTDNALATERALPAVQEMLDVNSRPAAERYWEDPQVRSLVQAARERFGDSVEAVVLYGSFTRGTKDTLLDFYILLRDFSALPGWQATLGKLLAPIAFLIGVPWAEANTAGSLIGQKFVINEFFAYLAFMDVRDELSPYSQLVVTFALCGFSNLGSIAILLGGLGAVIPKRRHDIARLGLKAVIGGTLVNLMNAALAGFFFSLTAA